MTDKLVNCESNISSQFGTTSWTLIIEARNNEDSGLALEQLCKRYWKPVYAYCRKYGLYQQDAEDVTQEFFTYFFEKAWLKQADKEMGSFRGFILTLLKYFLSNRRRVANAQKRGAKLQISLDGFDFAEAIVTTDIDASRAYDKVWALCVADIALGRLFSEQKTVQQKKRFEYLKNYLTHVPTTSDYDVLVKVLDEPRNTIAVALHRLIRRYGELIRLEVADTAKDTFQVDEELRYLIKMISA